MPIPLMSQDLFILIKLSNLKDGSIFVETALRATAVQHLAAFSFSFSLPAPCWILSYVLLHVCYTISLVHCWQNALNCYVYLGHFPQHFLSFL